MMAVEHQATAPNVVKPSTFAAMERWVRWRNGVGGGMVVIGGSSGGLLGRLQQGGRYHKQCPRCRGKRRIRVENSRIAAERTCYECGGTGKVAADLAPTSHTRTVPCSACKDAPKPGEVNGTTCIKCRGTGVRLEVEHYVHPATIPGTRHLGRDVGDPVAELINRTVYGWRQRDETWWMFAVVIEYYSPDEAHNGRRTQEQMAARLGINPPFFSKTLKKAHLTIQELLENGMQKRGY